MNGDFCVTCEDFGVVACSDGCPVGTDDPSPCRRCHGRGKLCPSCTDGPDGLGDVPPGVGVDVAWVDDNDGRGPVKLSNSVRCF